MIIFVFVGLVRLCCLFVYLFVRVCACVADLLKWLFVCVCVCVRACLLVVLVACLCVCVFVFCLLSFLGMVLLAAEAFGMFEFDDAEKSCWWFPSGSAGKRPVGCLAEAICPFASRGNH